MLKAFKHLVRNVRKDLARRRLEEDSKYVIDDFGPIASAFEHYGTFGRPFRVADEQGAEDDASSVSSFSTTATMDDNPGAGCTIDKYFYQPVGRRVETLLSRIALPFLSPDRIYQYIEEKHSSESISFDSHILVQGFELYLDMDHVYLAGLNSLVHQTQ